MATTVICYSSTPKSRVSKLSVVFGFSNDIQRRRRRRRRRRSLFPQRARGVAAPGGTESGGDDDSKEAAGDQKYVSITLDDVNLVGLGRRSRQIFDETGQETDFVLVSCAGLGIEPSRREHVLKAKKGRILLDVQVLVTLLSVLVLYGHYDSTARNKSFDVCYEYMGKQGEELYELVAPLPDKANNYFTPALSALEKNT